MSENYPQLSFQINNGDVQNTIYTTTDASLNNLTLQITTNANNTGFTPGTLVPPSQAGSSTGSLLYLDLTNLSLSAAEFSALAFSADGWSFHTYTDAGQVVGMTPTADLTLNSGAGNSINIKIDNLGMSNPPSGNNVQLVVTYYRVQGITLGNMGIPTNFKVLLQNPPDGQADLHNAIQLSVLQPLVVNSIPSYTPVQNTLSFSFGPGPSPSTINAAADTSFTVTFIYDDADKSPGYGALSTTAEAGNFSLQRGTNAQSWGVSKGSEQQNPSWLLHPPKGQPIIGSGSQSTVQFIISDIVTNFQPGPTLMLVSYTKVPGYQDGSFSITLEKVPHVNIKSFTVSPDPSTLVSGQAQVTLSWEVYNAGTLTLMPLYQDVTNLTSFNATIGDTTHFTLEADGTQLANAGNIAFAHETATVLPVINSFNAVPDSIYYKDFPRSVNLSWNVNTNEQVTLTSSVTGGSSTQYQPVGQLTQKINQPQMLTLAPAGAASDEADDEDSNLDSNLRVQRSIILSAFQPESATYNLGGAAGAVAAAPNAPFVAAVIGGQLVILDTLGYQSIGSGVQLGNSPQGMVFSPDGNWIYVANSGDGTVSVVQVTATGTTPPYSLNNVATLNVGGSPMRVATSPDGKYLYVVVVIGGGSQNGSLVVMQNHGNGQFTQLTSITVGVYPIDVAVSPSGAQIFVANDGSLNISMIGVSSSGQHSLVGTIGNLPSAPFSLAVTYDGNQLLVVCPDSKSVVSINTAFPGTSPRKSYTVGSNPSHIATSPNGAYIFISNTSGGTVSLLSYDPNSQNLTVLEQGIQVSSNPSSLTASSEGGLLIVADLQASALTVLTLAQYQQQTQPSSVGAAPTSVAVAPDGSKVFIWHDNSTSEQGKTPGTGFSVYEIESQTVTSQMQGSNLFSFAVSTTPSDTSGYISQVNQGDITVVNTTTYLPTGTISIQPKSNAATRYPRNLAVSADGTRLFAIIYNGQSQYSIGIWEKVSGGFNPITDLVLFTTSSQSTAILLCVSPDGSYAYAVDSVDSKLWVVQEQEDGSYQIQQNPVSLGNAPAAITILPDASMLYVLNKGGMTNSISMINTANLEVNTVFMPESFIAVSLNSLVASPDSTKIFITDGAMAGIRVLDAATLRFIQTISWTSNVQFPFGIAVLPDGSQIFTANMNSNNLGIIQQVQPA